MRLENKKTLFAGGGSGIGLAVARRLADANDVEYSPGPIPSSAHRRPRSTAALPQDAVEPVTLRLPGSVHSPTTTCSVTSGGVSLVGSSDICSARLTHDCRENTRARTVSAVPNRIATSRPTDQFSI
jgi:hypothetical protein